MGWQPAIVYPHTSRLDSHSLSVYSNLVNRIPSHNLGKTRTKPKVAHKSKSIGLAKSLKRPKSSRLWKNRYVKTTILVLLFLSSVIAFWFCLRAAFKSEYPLLSIDVGSMRPTLNIGDLVVVLGLSDASKIRVGEKNEGDIIVFRRPSNPDELVVQRAISKTLVDGVWYFRTQGDNASSPAWWIEGQNAGDTWNGLFHEKFLIGKVVGKIPCLGYVPLYVGAFLRTPVAMFLFVVLVFLVILMKYPSLLKKKAKVSS